MAWLAEAYPDTFDQYYRPRWDKAPEDPGRRRPLLLPAACRSCARSARSRWRFTEPGDPTTICQRDSDYDGEHFNFCSDGCQWIFEREPEKYVQAWLPVHQIYQGNCGGPTVPDVLAWYGIQPRATTARYLGSVDNVNWKKWHAQVDDISGNHADEADEAAASAVKEG